jgi:hypothetical protein
MSSALDWMKSAAVAVEAPEPAGAADEQPAAAPTDSTTPSPDPEPAPATGTDTKADDVTTNPFETAGNPFAQGEAPTQAETAPSAQPAGLSDLFASAPAPPVDSPAPLADIFAASAQQNPVPSGPETAVPESPVSQLFETARAEKEQKPAPAPVTAEAPGPTPAPSKDAKPAGLDAKTSTTVRRLAKEMGLGEMDVIAQAVRLLDVTRASVR